MEAKKKRNPQDATMRNARSLSKRVAALEVIVKQLTKGAKNGGKVQKTGKHGGV